MVVGYKCDPADGSSSINPKNYKDKIVIAFSEPMSEVTVYDTEPKFPYSTELSNDIFIISFKDEYTMPKGKRFTVWLRGTDLAGIELEKCEGCHIAEYSFTTKAN